jgi:hypothetical protein
MLADMNSPTMLLKLAGMSTHSRSPTSPVLDFLQERLGYHAMERQERWDEAMAGLAGSLREGVPWCWQELRAVETVLDEVAEEFNGEDPLLPHVRGVLEEAHQGLLELHPLLHFVDVEADLPEPDEKRVEFLRQRWLSQDM